MGCLGVLPSEWLRGNFAYRLVRCRQFLEQIPRFIQVGSAVHALSSYELPYRQTVLDAMRKERVLSTIYLAEASASVLGIAL